MEDVEDGILGRIVLKDHVDERFEEVRKRTMVRIGLLSFDG